MSNKPPVELEALRTAYRNHFKPQDPVEESYVQQISSAWHFIHNNPPDPHLESILDDYTGGESTVSNQHLAVAMREFAEKDRLVNNSYRLARQATNALFQYRQTRLAA